MDVRCRLILRIGSLLVATLRWAPLGLLLFGAAAPARAASFAYVASGGGGVLVINVATNQVVANVALPASIYPSSVVASPDGSRVYAVNSYVSPTMLVTIETATNSVALPPIPLPNGATALAVSPDGRYVCASVQFSNSVSVVDTASQAVVAAVPVGPQPTGIRFAPDGSRVYVAHSLNLMVSVIDTTTWRTVPNSIVVGANSQDLTVARDGSTLYVTNFNSDSVSVIDTGSLTVRATIPVGFWPLGLDTSPDGRRLYVADYNVAVSNGFIAVIDTTTSQVVGRVALPSQNNARRVVITPDGTRGYVTINNPQQVVVFDTATNQVIGDPIPAATGIPEGITIATRSASDFNGDSRSDILWHLATRGEVWLWPMNGAVRTAETHVRTVADTNWEIRGLGDMNGDGKADLLWRHKVTGATLRLADGRQHPDCRDLRHDGRPGLRHRRHRRL